MTRFAIVVAALIALAHPALGKTVIYDEGGLLENYHNELIELRKSGEMVRILGLCMSACTMYMSLPREQVCIGRRGFFVFHQARSHYGFGPRSPMATAYMMNNLQWWARKWIDERGGLTSKLLFMPNSYIRKYMRAC